MKNAREHGGKKPVRSRSRAEFCAWLLRPGGGATLAVCLYVAVWSALLGVLSRTITAGQEFLMVIAVVGGGITMWGTARALLQQQRFLVQRESIEELEESRALIRVLMDHLPVAIYLKSAEHRYLAANAAWARFAGCDLTHAIGRTDRELFRPEQADFYKKEDDIVLQTGNSVERDTSEELDGSEHLFHTLKVPVCNVRGEVVNIVGMTFDITKYRQAGHLLHTDRHLSGSSGEWPFAYVCVTNATGRIAFASADLCSLVGKSTGDVLDSDVTAMVTPADREKARSFLMSVADGDAVEVAEHFGVVDAHGLVQYLEVQGIPLAVQGAPIAGIALLSRSMVFDPSPEDPEQSRS